MITRDNIIHFYEKYKQSLKTEEQASAKSRNGKLGYPTDFDNTASAYCFFIELIQGKGRIYSPEPVELLSEDNVLQDDIVNAIESGMNRQVTKTIDMDVVCAAPEKWLGGTGETEQETKHGK